MLSVSAAPDRMRAGAAGSEESMAPRHNAIWLDTASAPPHAPLEADTRVDVAVIGGGLAGLTTAYQLARAGRRVAVLEQGRLGHGTTGHTTAMITQIFDTPLRTLVRDYGEDAARGVWQAGRRALDFIEAVVNALALDCDWRRVPAYHYAAEAGDVAAIAEEVRLARQLGFVADFTHECVVPPMHHGGMRVANQGQFHPLRYLDGLAAELARRGVAIHEHTHVSRVQLGAPCLVEANDCVVSADAVVVATRAVVSDRLFATRVEGFESYVLGYRVPRGALPTALAWDTASPYHYWRLVPQADADVVLIGGADHRTGQVTDTEACYDALQRYARTALSGVPHELAYRWSAEWGQPVDGLPAIGAWRGQYVATGFAGNGMTLATFAGMLLADLLLGRENDLADLFDPRHLHLRVGAVAYLEEGLESAAYYVGDRLRADATPPWALAPGEGRVLELDGRRVAASRDDRGRLHLLSPVCTHLGCLVHWNGAERTWDCPCHGSRYAPDGRVLSGPAIDPLARLEVPEKRR